jgi:hypothetical protein
MRGSIAGFVLRFMIGAFFAALLLPSAHGSDTGKSAAVARKLDRGCVDHELKVFAVIERYESERLQGAEILIDTAILVENARLICARGDVQEAMTIYKSALRQLHAQLKELGIEPAD